MTTDERIAAATVTLDFWAGPERQHRARARLLLDIRSDEGRYDLPDGSATDDRDAAVRAWGAAGIDPPPIGATHNH